MKNIAQQQRLVELEKTQHYFKLLSYKAYYSGSPIEVTVENNLLTINNNQEITQVEYKELLFIKTTFNIETTAVIVPNEFEVKWNGVNRKFKINAMFKSYENE